MIEGKQMDKYLLVGAGGAAGAMLRYFLSHVQVGSSFPVMTFVTNFLGAVFIGAVVGLSVHAGLSEGVVLFLKTGVCGGFTTFSTFSLETLNLLEQKQYTTAGMYMVLSLILCVAGVCIGREAVGKLFTYVAEAGN